MKQYNVYDLICAAILFFFLGVAFMGTCLQLSKATYKDGQIDYGSGRIKYVLKQQPSGETVWVEKEEDKK